MRKAIVLTLVSAVTVLGLGAMSLRHALRPRQPTSPDVAPLQADQLLANDDPTAAVPAVQIDYPYEGALFPPESIAPTFHWSSPVSRIDTWLIHAMFEGSEPIDAVVTSTEWTPDERTWAAFKTRSSSKPARVTILGAHTESPKVIMARGTVTIATSTDPVGAPIFYREVTLPFVEAVKDPAKIRWRFGAIDSRNQPPVVLEDLPVCGNCHSFSRDGRVLGMDVDYANDKGSYAVVETSAEMMLEKSKIISWSSFRRRDKQPTFGLLSQVSPDGRYVVSTVKDRSVFVPKPDVAFSQLFFPLKGILAFYDRQSGTFAAVPGANDPAYVQSNPTFSPDGKTLVFARSKAYALKDLKHPDKALLTPEECREFLDGDKDFKFELYRVSFNDGKGGRPEPLEGASANGQSNYFARYSPDGKWIVFCRSSNFMLLQPDSELYIIPAEGGEARRLGCNGKRMNSWHSWSPNGKWLVFSSKANTAYTQLMLAHIDEQGDCAPPVILTHFTAPDRAANIPEFVNLPPNGIAKIHEHFVDDESYTRTARENLRFGELTGAEALYRKALTLNPDNAEAHSILGGLLVERGQLTQGHEHLNRALELAPSNAVVHFNLANALTIERRNLEAVQSWKKVVELEPTNLQARTNLGAVLLGLGRLTEAEQVLRAALAKDPSYAPAHHNLGNVLLGLKRKDEASHAWREALRLDPNLFDSHLNLGLTMLEANEIDGAFEHLSAALRLRPTDTPSMINLAVVHEKQGKRTEAIQLLEQARQLARTTGQTKIERDCAQRLKRLRTLHTSQ